MMKRLVTASLLSTALLVGCVAEESTDIDQQLLTEYRGAIPTLSQLEAAEVQGTTTALGEPAVLPTTSYPIVEGINGGVAMLIGLVEAVVELPPTVFNSDTQEFVWGPFDNDDGVGFVAVYIRDTGSDEDFRYHYAFLRGIDNDLANMTPVIVGGSSPGEDEDHGVGLALIDFEASYQFEQAHNPDADSLEMERGRVAYLFAAGPDDEDPNNEGAFVIAAFRDFVSADEPDATPIALDYMYGRYVDNNENHTLDFLNWKAPMDVDEDGSAAEDLDIRMAFFDEGIGRAEAIVTGGDLDAGASASLTECWDTSISQTFIRMELSGDGRIVLEEGNPEDCGAFNTSLASLGIPAIDDIDAELRTGLSTLASTGEFAE